jgi:hypothetical protein
MGRWGEKVPATVGTVADRFALSHLCALNLERAFLTTEGTRSSAVGTGLLLTQGVGLLFEEGLQGALGETGSGGVSNLLHCIEIDVEPRPVVAEGASGDDFAPLGGQVTEFLEFFGGERTASHDASCVGVGTSTTEKRVPSD